MGYQAVTVLPVDTYEEREVKGRGVGVFALKPIPTGSRVLCEAPLLALPEDADVLTLYCTINELGDEEQAQFWSLAASTEPCTGDDWIEQLLAMSSQDETDSFDKLVETHEKAMSIYETNRFTLRSPSGGMDRLGVFPTAARINHSCTPNVFHRYNTNIERFTMHALHDIMPEEEILTSYIDLCQPTVDRQNNLRHWGFECRCDLCVKHDEDGEWRRNKLRELLGCMKYRESQESRSCNNADSLSTIETAIEIMELEGLFESDTLGEACRKAAQLAIVVGRHEDAREWAVKAADMERKCCGSDSREYSEAVALLESMG